MAVRRGLRPEFMSDLTSGVLAPLLDRVRRDSSLCLEIREDYINVYYRGGNLLRLSSQAGGYLAYFDTKYFSDLPSGVLPAPQVCEPTEVAAWLLAVPVLKQAMDLYLTNQRKEERDLQQVIVRQNNFGPQARQTDYYICDLEYASPNGQFDLVAVRWPSTSAARKLQDRGRLVVVEVKCGDGALEGPSGLHAHVRDVNNHLGDRETLADLKKEMVRVFNQKRALGVLDCGKDLTGFSDELPMFLVIVINHDPEASRLRELLNTMPPSPHAEIRLATSCLMGFGLYDPSILTVQEALTRLPAFL